MPTPEPSPEEPRRRPAQRRAEREQPFRLPPEVEELDEIAEWTPAGGVGAGPGGGDGPPPPVGGGGDGTGSDDDGSSPQVLLDRLLGRRPGQAVSALGREARAVADLVAPHEEPEPLLAGVYWWTVMRTPTFRRAMATVGARRDPDHRMMVPHAGGTRFDLLMLVPGLNGPARPLRLPLSNAELAETWIRATRGRSSVVDVIRARYPRVRSHQLAMAVREAGRWGDFGVVVGPAPVEEATAVPVPANGVGTELKRVATVGAVVRDGTGWAVTTALHAVEGNADQVFVDGHPGEIVGRDQLTDSCLIRTADAPPPGLEGRAGPADTVVPPGVGSRVHFNRVGEGRVETTITGIDMSVFEPQQSFADKVYTLPDTRKGDSGAALVDRMDRIVAFASRRSSLDAPIRFATWIWAPQVFDMLGVKP